MKMETKADISIEEIKRMAEKGYKVKDLQKLDIKAKSMEELCNNKK